MLMPKLRRGGEARPAHPDASSYHVLVHRNTAAISQAGGRQKPTHWKWIFHIKPNHRLIWMYTALQKAFHGAKVDDASGKPR
ncbi:MAG: hypothetical protein PVJ15_06800, partial [Gammaproteobacteria bacterium]